MVNRKAFMRTLEVLAAILLVFIFVLVIIPMHIPASQPGGSLMPLSGIQHDEVFLACLADSNTPCIAQLVQQQLPPSYEGLIVLQKSLSEKQPTLPRQTLSVDTLYTIGNITHANTTIVTVYAWRK